MHQDIADNCIFFGKDVSFEMIINQNALGGLNSLKNYLLARRQSILRSVATEKQSADNADHYFKVLACLDCALSLLPRIVSYRTASVE